ncbi:MFS transporter [Frankia sp. Cppng1_Ct_nod]|uniref:MFS transporter n=1 Tax=Frankia sp. Cppng1_Ct_nod TaxID=2897162 RepID=UPI001A948FA2
MGLEEGVWASRIPAIKADLSLGYGTLGLALFAIPLGTVIVLPAAGFLVDRVSSRAVLRWAAPCATSALIFPGLAPNAAALTAALTFFGAALCFLNISMNAHAVQVEQVYDRPIMAGFHASYSLAAIVGAGLGGLFAYIGLSARPTFILVSGFLAVVAILVGQILPSSPVEDVRREVEPKGLSTATVWRAILALGLLATCAACAEGAMTDWIAVYFHDDLGGSTWIGSAGLISFSSAVAVGRIFGDRLNERLEAVPLVRVSGLIAGTSLIVTLLASEPIVALVGFFLVGAGISCMTPQVVSASGRLGSNRSGRSLSVITGMSTIGNLGGPVVIGFAANGTGLRIALMIPAFLVLVVAASASVLQPPSRQA